MSEHTQPMDSARAGALLGSKLGHYRITELLGTGGMGEVYAAFDEALERKVAIKAIRGRHTRDPAVKGRFLREARILSRLEHPNICQIHDLLDTEHGDFLVLELIQGVPLREVTESDIPRAQRLEIASQILGALSAAHKEGVVHRDLKPANVMVTDEGRVVVLDFGLALSLVAEDSATVDLLPPLRPRETGMDDLGESPTVVGGGGVGTHDAYSGRYTAVGSVLGTPAYMSPEQARGAIAGPASDMYSFGLLLREILAGDRIHPVGASNEELFVKAMRAEAPDVAGLPKPLRSLVDDLASPEHQQRPSAEAALARIAAVQAQPRRRLLLLGMVVAVLALVKYGYDVTTARSAAVAAQAASELARGQAEDLATFMLDDLLNELEPRGMTDVLDRATQKTLTYFEQLPPELHDQTPERLVKALNAVGHVRQTMGELELAKEIYERSEALARSVVVSDATADTAVLHQLARALAGGGYVAERQGEFEQAREKHQEAIRIDRQLLETDRTNAVWLENLSADLGRLGHVFQASGELDEGRRAFEEALTIGQQLLTRDPDNTTLERSLAFDLSYLGNIFAARGEFARARSKFEEALEIRRKLFDKDPTHALWRRDLAFDLGKLGTVATIQDQLELAASSYEEALRLDRWLLDNDPSNVRWQEFVSLNLSSLADVYRVRGDLDRAILTYREAIVINRTLHRQDPSNVESANGLAWDLLILGRAVRARGESEEGIQLVTESVEILQPFVDRGELATFFYDTYVCALLELGRVEQARPFVDRLIGADWHLDASNQPFLELADRYGLLPEVSPAEEGKQSSIGD